MERIYFKDSHLLKVINGEMNMSAHLIMAIFLHYVYACICIYGYIFMYICIHVFKICKHVYIKHHSTL